jgi:hypothetical protein
MPEVIQLDDSPSELLAAAADDDAEVAAPQQQDAGAMNDDEDEGQEEDEPVRFHEVLSNEDKEERRQLIRKIGRYRALFARELEDIHTGGLDQMPLDALRDLGRDVEFLVGTRRSAKAVRGMFIGGLQAGEVVGPFVGLDLTGLASVAAASEDLLQTVDEVAIAHEKSLYVDPVARLGLERSPRNKTRQHSRPREPRRSNRPTLITRPESMTTYNTKAQDKNVSILLTRISQIRDGPRDKGHPRRRRRAAIYGRLN